MVLSFLMFKAIKILLYKVVEVSESKGISFNDFDEVVCRFKFGIRIGKLKGIDNLVLVFQKGPKDRLKDRIDLWQCLVDQVKEMLGLFFLEVKEQ